MGTGSSRFVGRSSAVILVQKPYFRQPRRSQGEHIAGVAQFEIQKK